MENSDSSWCEPIPSDTALILKELIKLNQTISELLALSKSKRQSAPTVDIAPDSDLDSPYGDEPVKFKPRDWSGEFVKGQRMSECAPEMLDMLAASFDYFAEKKRHDATMADKMFYDQRSARRARGWAARLRAGWQAPKPVESSEVTW